MKVQIESAGFIYDDGQLVGLIKRDEKSQKTVVYTVQEANVEDVNSFINHKE